LFLDDPSKQFPTGYWNDALPSSGSIPYPGYITPGDTMLYGGPQNQTGNHIYIYYIENIEFPKQIVKQIFNN